MSKQPKSGSIMRPTKTARLVVSWLFKNDPYISDVQINKELAKLEFPNDRLSVKDASHYRLLYNKKRLPPPPDEDPRGW